MKSVRREVHGIVFNRVYEHICKELTWKFRMPISHKLLDVTCASMQRVYVPLSNQVDDFTVQLESSILGNSNIQE